MDDQHGQSRPWPQQEPFPQPWPQQGQQTQRWYPSNAGWPPSPTTNTLPQQDFQQLPSPSSGYEQQWSQLPPQQPFPQQIQWSQQQLQQTQQPFPQQQLQQPAPRSRRSNRRSWLILGSIAVIAIVAIIGASILILSGHKSPSGTSSSTNESGINQATTQQFQSTGNTIGKPVHVGNTWIVTVNSVRYNTGDGVINVPQAGHIFLVVYVTFKNISPINSAVSSPLMFRLTDSSGQMYTQEIAYGNSPDGAVRSGHSRSGQIAYEVPLSKHSFLLLGVAAPGTNSLNEWNIPI